MDAGYGKPCRGLGQADDCPLMWILGSTEAFRYGHALLVSTRYQIFRIGFLTDRQASRCSPDLLNRGLKGKVLKRATSRDAHD